jgi:hypothetical protein
MIKQRFYCPAEGCDATYNVDFRSHEPTKLPACKQCGHAFPATVEGVWVHYRPAPPRR